MMGEKAAQPDKEDARAIVREAFHQARDTGKSDWRRMTAAVLKNRILISHKGFSERELGFDRFTDFLESLEGLVSVDRSKIPPVVELLDTEAGTQHAPIRVRSDLWQATMDYASGKPYVWDPESGVARLKRYKGDEDLSPIPTVTPLELQEWRQRFQQEAAEGADDTQKARLQTWASSGLRTGYLPMELRPLWNEKMREYVSARLDAWFKDKGLKAPDDLLTTTRPPLAKATEDSTERLRSLLVKIAQMMTMDELRAVHVPLSAIDRLLARTK